MRNTASCRCRLQQHNQQCSRIVESVRFASPVKLFYEQIKWWWWWWWLISLLVKRLCLVWHAWNVTSFSLHSSADTTRGRPHKLGCSLQFYKCKEIFLFKPGYRTTEQSQPWCCWFQLFKALQVYTEENRFLSLLKILVRLILVSPTRLHLIPCTDIILIRCIFFVLLVLCKWRHIRPLVSMYAYIVFVFSAFAVVWLHPKFWK